MVQNAETFLEHIQKRKCEVYQGKDLQKFDEYLTLENWITQNKPRLQLDFPFDICETEKPDFLLVGKITTGIEVTTFQIPQEARAQAMTQGYHLLNHAPNLGFDSPKETKEQTLSQMSMPVSSAGQFRDMGHDLKLYVGEFLEIIDEKTGKAIVNGNHKCDSNILIIEDRKILSSFYWNAIEQEVTRVIDKYFLGLSHFDEIWFIDGNIAGPKSSMVWRCSS